MLSMDLHGNTTGVLFIEAKSGKKKQLQRIVSD
jgi:hypothetical protein